VGLRDIIERCLERLADEMERDVGAFERQRAAETDKLAG
jgi:hypothetical protein